MNINDAKLFVDIIEYATKKELVAISRQAKEISNDLAVHPSTRLVWREFNTFLKTQIRKY